jgi:hypothetical protein
MFSVMGRLSASFEIINAEVYPESRVVLPVCRTPVNTMILPMGLCAIFWAYSNK